MFYAFRLIFKNFFFLIYCFLINKNFVIFRFLKIKKNILISKWKEKNNRNYCVKSCGILQFIKWYDFYNFSLLSLFYRFIYTKNHYISKFSKLNACLFKLTIIIPIVVRVFYEMNTIFSCVFSKVKILGSINSRIKHRKWELLK